MLVCKHIKRNFLYIVIIVVNSCPALFVSVSINQTMSTNSQPVQPPAQTSTARSNANECIELKNLKYKSMMLKNNQRRGDAAMQMLHNTSATDSISNVEKYLDHERSRKTTDLWGKLDKTVKLTKLNAFAQKYIHDNGLPECELTQLVTFLTTCIDHKKIVKTKDVVYDKVTGMIISIPILTHVNSGSSSSSSSSLSLSLPTTSGPSPVKFTLRRCEKRPSTLKSLPHGHSKFVNNNNNNNNKMEPTTLLQIPTD
jgi:hypothetical protein